MRNPFRRPPSADAADLFAGLGGFSEGARQAGMRVVYAANHLPAAVDFHRQNHPEAEHICQDLVRADWTRLPRIDFLLAGPACQGHSTAGQPARKGTGGSHRPDRRRICNAHQQLRETALSVVTAAEFTQPRAVLIENVPTIGQWDLFPWWLDGFRALGYHVAHGILRAPDFGSCQERERMFIMAHRDRMPVLPTGTVGPRAVGEVLFHDEHPENRWSDIGRKSERMRTRMRKAQNEAGRRCLWNNVSESAGRPLDGLAPTLTTKSGSQLYLLDGDRGRILNPRELARIQGLPDGYALPVKRETCSLLIGNAIPVELSRAVAGAALTA